MERKMKMSILMALACAVAYSQTEGKTWRLYDSRNENGSFGVKMGEAGNDYDSIHGHPLHPVMLSWLIAGAAICALGCRRGRKKDR